MKLVSENNQPFVQILVAGSRNGLQIGWQKICDWLDERIKAKHSQFTLNERTVKFIMEGGTDQEVRLSLAFIERVNKMMMDGLLQD